MSNKGRSNAAKKRRHAKAMAKRAAQKAMRKAEYEARIRTGTNSKRKQIAKRKGKNKLAPDRKGQRPVHIEPYVSPGEYWRQYWAS